MRPLQLSFTGLRSYPNDGPPIDFTGKTLVGILGDTGAGKSTILEALCVALYGSCSWSDRDVRELIADSSPTMTVDLTFTHNGQSWRVRRAYHANSKPSSHLLQNLDTAEAIDNARPVDKAITAMLGLRYEAFKASVLLPQGKFAELLHATGSARTKLLKGLFEVDLLETVRDRAAARSEALTQLVHEAELARARLRDDPAGAAETARRQAETATTMAESLSSTLEELRRQQDELRKAQDRRQALQSAAEPLKTTTRTALAAATRRLDKLDATEAELTEAARGLDAREAEARTGLAVAIEALQQAATSGDTPESLAAAHARLVAVPQQLTDLTDTDRLLVSEEQRLAAEVTRLAAAEQQIGGDTARVSELALTAEQARPRAEQASTAVSAIREHITLALDAAAAVASAATAERQVRARAEQTEAQLPDAVSNLSKARHRAEAAAADLARLQRTEWAASAGAHLHSGDQCPVCVRELPDHYTPPAPADPLRLADATQANTDAAEQAREAERKHAADISTAQSERQHATDLAADLREAAERLKRDIATARTQIVGSPTATSESIEPRLDTGTLDDQLAAAVATIIDGDGDRRRNIRRATIKRLMAGPDGVVATLQATARTDAEAASTAAHALETAGKMLRQNQKTLHRDRQRLKDDQRHRNEAEQRLRATLQALPPSLNAARPEPATALPDQAQIAKALEILAVRREQIDEQVNKRDHANTAIEQIGQRRLGLANRRTEEITNQIQTLLQTLNPVTLAIQNISALLQPRQLPSPDAPQQQLNPDTAWTYLADLTASADRALDGASTELRAQAATVTRIAGHLAKELAVAQTGHAQAGGLASHTGSLAVPARQAHTSAADDLTKPNSLDALAEAGAWWRTQATSARREQSGAEAEIPQATRLDEALVPARLRLAALAELRAHLTDAKFLKYLISQRTNALLGTASDIFGRLSGGQFGFTEDFQVAARRSQIARSPRTLSGGETFLGSLALSLALVEMYARGGGRLGALFLDEGFDTLDADNLTTALSVLRQEAGTDKLVAVITHIHSVAEVVDDVLWVAKEIGGSTASWLDPIEREHLIRDDIADGLLSLTG
ncbi:MAG: repair protein SbcC/Rad50 [Actinoplanes sp.]|nr:repair protein SbcC/Rad50 [Actinoplanes sp.]MDT5032591.1 repair protein SbcC/Rad50 [Actinoplanes sp.]